MSSANPAMQDAARTPRSIVNDMNPPQPTNRFARRAPGEHASSAQLIAEVGMNEVDRRRTRRTDDLRRIEVRDVERRERQYEHGLHGSGRRDRYIERNRLGRRLSES